MALAWGARVSADFRARVLRLAAQHNADPSDFMACMAFESGETFRADIRNAAGSGAVGLIQFMPQTAASLGTTTSALALMSPEAQLDYVVRYFKPWIGRLKTLGDIYGAILWPSMIGRADSYVLFDREDEKRPKLYIQNRGLDFNKDGKITRAEACAAVVAKRSKGLRPGLVWEG